MLYEKSEEYQNILRLAAEKKDVSKKVVQGYKPRPSSQLDKSKFLNIEHNRYDTFKERYMATKKNLEIEIIKDNKRHEDLFLATNKPSESNIMRRQNQSKSQSIIK